MFTETRFFDIAALARTLPETAETMLTDLRLTDEHDASCRIFRVYRAVPAHYHTCSDEYLYVLTGAPRFRSRAQNCASLAPEN